MKEHLKIIPILFIPLLFSACQNNANSSSNQEAADSLVKLSQTSITLSEDKSFQLEVVLDDSLKGKMLFWTMRDEEIAKVENGLVTAIKEGNTICTVQCGQYNAKCAVNVTPYEPIEVLDIKLNKHSYNLQVGDVFDLPIKVTLGNEIIINYVLSGESDNANVAIIENETIKAIGAGYTNIILKVEYEYYVCQDVIDVNVL